MLKIVIYIPMRANIESLQVSELESDSHRNQNFTVESESYWNRKKFRYLPITSLF